MSNTRLLRYFSVWKRAQQLRQICENTKLFSKTTENCFQNAEQMATNQKCLLQEVQDSRLLPDSCTSVDTTGLIASLLQTENRV